jgi:hypothetical protein
LATKEVVFHSGTKVHGVKCQLGHHSASKTHRLM